MTDRWRRCRTVLGVADLHELKNRTFCTLLCLNETAMIFSISLSYIKGFCPLRAALKPIETRLFLNRQKSLHSVVNPVHASRRAMLRPSALSLSTPSSACQHILGTICILLLFGSCTAKLTYQLNGAETSLTATQLWYDGYWQPGGWTNGTLVPYTSTDIEGNIALVFGSIASAPYEPILRHYCSRGAIAIIILLDPLIGVAGGNMYTIDGLEQLSINVPVVEVHQAVGQLTNIPSTGIKVELLPDINEWKIANDMIAYQITWSVILTLMQIAIVLLGYHRLYLFWSVEGVQLLSIAQLCLYLEIVSAVLRIMATIVDPFFAFRIVPYTPSSVFVSISMPFEFASGILLTFFWAETLTATRVTASPFISEYKKSAIIVIAILFVGEVVCTSAGAKITNTSFKLGYIPIIFYLVVSLVLTVCYIVCAVNILKRLVGSNRNHMQLGRMTWRLIGSAGGYIVFVLSVLALAGVNNWPWGWKICSNLLFLACNITAFLQVWSFLPVRHFQHSSKSSSQILHSAPFTV